MNDNLRGRTLVHLLVIGLHLGGFSNDEVEVASRIGFFLFRKNILTPKARFKHLQIEELHDLYKYKYILVMLTRCSPLFQFCI